MNEQLSAVVLRIADHICGQWLMTWEDAAARRNCPAIFEAREAVVTTLCATMPATRQDLCEILGVTQKYLRDTCRRSTAPDWAIQYARQQIPIHRRAHA